MTAPTAASSTSHHQSRMKSAKPSSTMVGKGMVTPGWPRIGAIRRGSRKVTAMMMLTPIMHATMSG